MDDQMYRQGHDALSLFTLICSFFCRFALIAGARIQVFLAYIDVQQSAMDVE